MHRTNGSFTGLLLVVMLILPGCIDSGPSEQEQQKALEKINKNTMSVAISLKSMLDEEQSLQQRQAVPLMVQIQTWWIALTSTRLNLARIKTTLTEYPETIEAARNLWAGRIQDNMNKIIGSGTFTTMTGPITSRLAQNYDESRVKKEISEVLELSAQISTLLGIKSDASTE